MMVDDVRTVSAGLVVAAAAEEVFAVVADPAKHPLMDGNGNTSQVQGDGGVIAAAGGSFLMLNSNGKVRENRVVEFDAGRLVAWMPCPVGGEPFGFLWRWECDPLAAGADGLAQTRVTHTYSWAALTDESLFDEARTIGEANLMASLQRVKALVEG
ncbi:SRPBCC family protein [Propionibacteriaceae bacterium G1746]|uniref:SRPBCC family protein n=1 Tax=Aestuariimicrobium sp. G57 TaxID=3418485 RepID=UPI003C27CB35